MFSPLAVVDADIIVSTFSSIPNIPAVLDSRRSPQVIPAIIQTIAVDMIDFVIRQSTDHVEVGKSVPEELDAHD